MTFPTRTIPNLATVMFVQKGSPGVAMLRQTLVKKMSASFPNLQPAEREDLLLACSTLAVNGGQRNEESLKPLIGAIDRHCLRVKATAAERELMLGNACLLYRHGMKFVRSTLEILEPGYNDKVLAEGSEAVPIIESEMVEPGNIAAGMRVWENPQPAAH